MMISCSQGSPYSRFMGIGAARGHRIVTNADMCTMIDSSDEWIRQRTGIIERRWIDDSQDALSLAYDAARQAIDSSTVSPSKIDAVIVATLSNKRLTPSLAAVLADRLGLVHPAALDISAACAGFCYATSLADSMIRTGSAHHVLVVGVEVLSQITDMSDRSTAFLFGDGAGAVVIGPSATPGIGPVIWGSRGDLSEVITIDNWDDSIDQGSYPVIHMEGNKVFKWAITDIATAAVRAVEAAGIQPADLDAFIPHQANDRIIDAMLRRLNLPDSVQVSRDIAYMGNTSAASIPLAMESMLSSGQASSGDLALIIGFGAGLVFAGQVIVLP